MIYHILPPRETRSSQRIVFDSKSVLQIAGRYFALEPVLARQMIGSLNMLNKRSSSTDVVSDGPSKRPTLYDSFVMLLPKEKPETKATNQQWYTVLDQDYHFPGDEVISDVNASSKNKLQTIENRKDTKI